VLAGHFERCGKEKTMHKVLLDRNPIDVGPDKASAYALGYSEREFKRLELQGAFIRDLTDDVLKRAGLTRGMRVLDLGCGVGDVSLMAGEVVGPTGAVLGVDRSAEAIATAERRAVEAGQCYWVRFAATELEHFVPDGAFDAIIGRLILMYLPDPAATMPAAKIIPDRPIFSRCRRWILEAFERGGVEIEMGPRLFATFLEAGLPAPQMIAAQRVEGGPQTFAYDYVAETLRSLLPLMEQVGVATAEEVEVDTLAERLRGEALASSACIMLPPLVGAWTHIPA
jgi:SAM-dependent methyltransferase